MGAGRFIAPKTIELGLNDGATRVLTGDRVAPNFGTHASIADIPGLVAAEPLTNLEALEVCIIRSLLVAEPAASAPTTANA
jgi:hypothetical protein